MNLYKMKCRNAAGVDETAVEFLKKKSDKDFDWLVTLFNIFT